uniref:CC domain-containing protein n=1 Tax=Parastrongyloides trichosuri TaxID=131310 RepID=A0A0N4ZB53_PARTI
MNRLLFLLLSFVVIFNLTNAFAAEKNGKVVVRTKRQQCICVYIAAQQSQIQCSCDQKDNSSNSASGTSNSVIQQQELQNELQQIQPFASSKCGCVLIVVKNSGYTGQSPQYQCSCGPESEVSTEPPVTTTTVKTTTSTQPPTTVAIKNSVIGAISKDGVTNPCRCVKLPSKSSSETTQYQCNCQNTQKIVPEYEVVDNSNLIIDDPIGITRVSEFEVTVPTTTTIQPKVQSFSSLNEPAVSQCIVIKIPSQSNTACVCSENYTQCTASTCCHKRMRSMRPYTSENAPVSKTETAVDLLMDVLKKIKTTL